MTIDEIKEKLPDVKVKVFGEVYNGMLSGREKQFPLVYVFELRQSYAFSWHAIYRAVNNNTALIV
jgi:hypothetical protein